MPALAHGGAGRASDVALAVSRKKKDVESFAKRKRQAARAQQAVPVNLRPDNAMEAWLPGGSKYTGERERQLKEAKGKEPS